MSRHHNSRNIGLHPSSPARTSVNLSEKALPNLNLSGKSESLSKAQTSESKGWFYAAALQYHDAGDKENAIRCARLHATDKLHDLHPVMHAVEINGLISLMEKVGDAESLAQLKSMQPNANDVHSVYTSRELPKGWKKTEL